MDGRQQRALGALAAMVHQFLDRQPDELLDSRAISAGEHAIGVLAEYGYMEEIVMGRIFGRWTAAGEALLKWNYPFGEQANKLFPLPPIEPSDRDR